MTNILKATGFLIAGLAVGWLVSAGMHPAAPVAGGVYNQVQRVFDQAGVHVGPTGSNLTGLQFGTCTGITYAALATSTPIDCAVTGALSTDANVLMWLAPAQPGANNFPFGITSGAGSSTNGYITARMFQIGNLSGGSSGFTATSSYPLATTSIRYLIFR